MRIITLGDSITDMGRQREDKGTIWGYGNGYPFFVAGELLSENPEKFEVINRGISGNRVVDLYARIKCDVWNLCPDVLSVLIGVNDVWHEIEGQNGVEIDRFDRVYRTIISETKERLPKCKIMLLEPFVLKGYSTEKHYEKFLKVKEYAKVVRKIAEDFDLPFIELQSKLDAAAAKHGAAYYLDDGVHPAIAGAKLIADEWIAAFNKYCR